MAQRIPARLELHDVAIHALAALAGAAERGVSNELLLKKTGLSGDLFDPPWSVIAYDHLARLILTAKDLTGGGAFGLAMVGKIPNEAMGPVYYELASCPTWGSALVISYEFLSEFSNLFRVHVDQEADVMRIVFTPAQSDAPAVREMLDFHMAHLTGSIFRYAYQGKPLVVHYRDGAEADMAVYEKAYGCQVRFNGIANYVEMDAAYFNSPMPAADPGLRKTIAPLLEEIRAGLKGPDALERAVRSAVVQQLGASKFSFERIARQLGVPARTLQHHLKQGGTTFRALVDDARSARAAALMDKPHLSIADISYHLGFASSTAFHRSFKRWTGQSPWEYRKLRQAGN